MMKRPPQWALRLGMVASAISCLLIVSSGVPPMLAVILGVLFGYCMGTLEES